MSFGIFFRVLIFLCLIGLGAWCIVWIIRYLVGADVRWNIFKIEKKVEKDEREVDEKIRVFEDNDKPKKKSGKNARK